MEILLNIVIIIIILGIIILVHELGHLIACKLTNVYVEEFAIGLGPKIYSKQKNENLYSVRLLPLGGFNKIRGEEFEDEETEARQDLDPRSLKNQTSGVKAFIYLSGVLMNILLAVFIFYAFLISMSFQWPIDPDFKDFGPVFGEVKSEALLDNVAYSDLVEGAGAERAGLPDEGYIKSINGSEIDYSYQAIEKFAEHTDDEVLVNACSEEDECNEYVVEVDEEGRIGIVLYSNYISYVQYSGIEKPFVGFVHIVNWGQLIGIALGDMFSEAAETGDYEELSTSVAGPVGLYVVVDYIREMGIWPLVDITANISLSVGIINLLPIPALDGGRVLMLLMEVVSGKKLNRQFEMWAIQISFLLLLLLMVGIVFKDIIYFETLQDLFT